MSTAHFGGVGCYYSIERDLRDRDFERGFLPETDSQGPTQRAVMPEPELFAVVRRIHESSHLIVGWVLGLKPILINSVRGLACVEWVVPAGQRAMAGFLIMLAASKAGQRKWGARALDWKCQDDDEKLLRYARLVTSGEEAAQLAVAKSYEAAERLVDEHWSGIEWFANVLERLGDRVEGLEPLLRHIKLVECEEVRHRRDGFVSDELWTRKGLARPRGYDVETREIDAVLSTGAAVRRQDWDGYFDEVLAMGAQNIRMQRLNAGASILDSHGWDKGIEARLGGVVPGSARIEGGALLARLKFSRGSPLAQRVVEDLRDGIQIPLSLGYKVHKSEENKRTNPVTRTATDWEPIEISVVPVGAESETGFRTAA
jgi:HK97 family phage prohead protease